MLANAFKARDCTLWRWWRLGLLAAPSESGSMVHSGVSWLHSTCVSLLHLTLPPGPALLPRQMAQFDTLVGWFVWIIFPRNHCRRKGYSFLRSFFPSRLPNIRHTAEFISSQFKAIILPIAASNKVQLGYFYFLFICLCFFFFFIRCTSCDLKFRLVTWK